MRHGGAALIESAIAEGIRRTERQMTGFRVQVGLVVGAVAERGVAV